MQKDNILFIFTDQWRADCVGFHGNKIVKTPNLDNLAQYSVDFTNSYTVCPLCTPARGSIMTGLYPHQSGVIDIVMWEVQDRNISQIRHLLG